MRSVEESAPILILPSLPFHRPSFQQSCSSTERSSCIGKQTRRYCEGDSSQESIEVENCVNLHVVEPVDREGERDGSRRVENEVEEGAVVFVRVEAIVELRLEFRVDVTEVKFPVDGEEDLVYRRKTSVRCLGGAERETDRGQRGER